MQEIGTMSGMINEKVKVRKKIVRATEVLKPIS
jgi:hypothetical protein